MLQVVNQVSEDGGEVTKGGRLAEFLAYRNIPLLKIVTKGPVEQSKDTCKMTKGPRKVKLVIVVNNKKE